MGVELNFVLDLARHLRAELIADGFDEAADLMKVPDHSVGIVYFNMLIRSIDPAPRSVRFSELYAKTFPSQHRLKVESLLKRVKRGDDLRPFQSRKFVKRKLLKSDGILNDWGVHHLHLSAKGTKEILMCHVTADTVYAIGFWPHDSWVSEQIVIALIDAFPLLFESLRAKGMEVPHLNEEQRQNLRDKNANGLFQHPTRGCYFPIGGGTMAWGGNVQATVRYDMLTAKLRQLEEISCASRWHPREFPMARISSLSSTGLSPRGSW
jgi:hypothetical protein